MKKYLILIFGLTLFNLTWAQDDSDEKDDKPASDVASYVITNKGDTVKGTITERDKKGVRFEGQKIKVQISDTEKKTYSPGKIKGYYKDDTWYESVQVGKEEWAFMMLLVDGALKLFQYDVEKVKGDEVEVTSTTYWIKDTRNKEFEPLQIKDKNFKTDMAGLCADYDDLAEEIRNKDYVFEDVEKVVKEFNKWFEEKAAKKKKK